jgi:hypothetical protein
MTTKWNTTTLSLERCKARGEDALRDAKFKGIVFFVIAGPEVDRANRYVDDVSDGF